MAFSSIKCLIILFLLITVVQLLPIENSGDSLALAGGAANENAIQLIDGGEEFHAIVKRQTDEQRRRRRRRRRQRQARRRQQQLTNAIAALQTQITALQTQVQNALTTTTTTAAAAG